MSLACAVTRSAWPRHGRHIGGERGCFQSAVTGRHAQDLHGAVGHGAAAEIFWAVGWGAFIVVFGTLTVRLYNRK